MSGTLSDAMEGSSRGFFEAVLDLVPVPTLLVEPGSARVLFANRAADELVGGPFARSPGAEEYARTYSVTDLSGRRLESDEHPGVRIARGERIEAEQVDLHLHERTVSLLVSGDVVVLPDGASVGVVAFEDVTAIREAERRAAFLAEAGAVLAGSLDYEETLRRVARIAVPAKADWCVVDMVDPTGALERLAVVHADPAREQLAWDLWHRWGAAPHAAEGPAAVVRTGRTLLVPEIGDEMLAALAVDDEHLAALRAVGLRSAISVPLLVRGEVAGVLSFASESRPYDEDDLALAVEVGRRAATAIEHARLYRERDHIAQTLQRSLLPARLPEIPGFDVAARYRAAGEGFEVGGDFYDLYECRPGTWSAVVGDVCGKGPEAASLTSLARYAMRAAALVIDEPVGVLEQVNETIRAERTGDRFLTAVLARVDAGGAVLTTVNAGHPPALVVRADGGVEALVAGGPLLGVIPNATFAGDRVELGPGDAVVLYTDGVLDAGAPERLLHWPDLEAPLAALAGRPAAEIAGAVEALAVEAADGAEPRDDIAVLVLRRC